MEKEPMKQGKEPKNLKKRKAEWPLDIKDYQPLLWTRN